jgi:mRNA interferase MazF
MAWPMRRGDVYLVDLNPPQGSEADKIRPAVIVSNNAANRAAERDGRGVVTVTPVTSNTARRVYAFQVLLPAGEAGLKAASKAQAEQIRSVDVTRLRTRLGTLPPERLARLDAAIRLHLAL